jgi:nucleoside-diphosphate-sugar epimerase
MKIAHSDLDYISEKLGKDLLLLKNSKIFITGGTGFIGKWLLESIIYANDQLNLDIKLTILSRNSKAFADEYPDIASQNILNFLVGDIRDFEFPNENFNFIIHAATEASSKMNIEDPLLMADVIVNGTRHVLDFALNCKTQKVLFLSSGAIYGKQPDNLEAFSEDFIGAPDPLDPGGSYALSKRMAEFLCATYARKYKINIPIARCFAFVGAYLPLEKHYAIGNFIRNGLNGQDITINGNGTPLRSYMYSADLVIWLLTLLLKGNSGEAYNVGSDVPISIKELALKVTEFFPGISVKILNQVRSTDRNQNYIPNINKAKTQFQFGEGISLTDSIFKTIQYYKQYESNQGS